MTIRTQEIRTYLFYRRIRHTFFLPVSWAWICVSETDRNSMFENPFLPVFDWPVFDWPMVEWQVIFSFMILFILNPAVASVRCDWPNGTTPLPVPVVGKRWLRVWKKNSNNGNRSTAIRTQEIRTNSFNRRISITFMLPNVFTYVTRFTYVFGS